MPSVRRAAYLLFVAGAALLGLSAGPSGQNPREAARERYAKFEYRVPMRDGTKLFTSVYVPREGENHPILLTRTPYSVAPYGADRYKTELGPSELFAKDGGYIFVYQDVRGRLMSEGEFVDVRPYRPVKSGPADVDESTDTWDTIDWLLKNVPRNNGKVGLYGISYPGFYTAMGMIDAHPALKAASPQAPISDWFVGDDFHHNGALYLAHAFGFISGFGWPRSGPTTDGWKPFAFGTGDGYAFYEAVGPMPRVNEKYLHGQVRFWNDMMEHETYDEFWKARNIRPHLKNIKPAVLTVGGWFDAEDLFGALEVYKNTERQSPGTTNTIVMGPWVHGGWARTAGDRLGDVRFGASTSRFYQEEIEFPFFAHLLQGKADPKLPEAWMFETGRNRWQKFAAWPPTGTETRSLYLASAGHLSFEPPAGEGTPYDEYVSDPSRPVPATSGIAIGMPREHMVDDQRFASRRPDVLTYRTEPLQDDLTIAGPIRPRLTVSTSGTDSDFVVKLIDVYPAGYPDPDPPSDTQESGPGATRMSGYQQLVRGEVFRGKFRNGYDAPQPFQPNEPSTIEYVMPDVLHTFRRGHRIMVQVQSTWFPLVNLNPQRFMNINKAREGDFQKATERVYHTREHASRIEVSVLR